MGKKINFNQEQLSEIRELYTNKNLSAESISKIFNCSKPRMFQELRRNNKRKKIGIFTPYSVF